MAKLSYQIDNPHTRPWALNIGLLIVNCSALEMELVAWLVQLSERVVTDAKLQKTISLGFTQKHRSVTRLVKERASSDTWRKDAEALWATALDVMATRNHVAHNPVMFGWHGKERGRPDFVFVPVTGSARKRKAAELNLKELASYVNQAASLVPKLELLRKSWCALRDEGKVPPLVKPLTILQRVQRRFLVAHWIAKERMKERSGK